MQLALIGYGRMGKTLESLAAARGHEIVAIVDPAEPDRAARHLTAETVERAEVCLEFTRPHAAADNVRRLCEMGKRTVVGTTGWQDRLEEIARVVAKHGGAVVYGANFSIGVNLFFRLVDRAAELFASLADHDMYVLESHHRAKLDAPSGTARRLAEIILARSRTKSRVAPPAGAAPISAEELHVAAVRAGWNPGLHRVGIEGLHESIILEHQLRSRDGLAEGALRAAEWLRQAPPGFHRFEDVLDDILSLP